MLAEKKYKQTSKQNIELWNFQLSTFKAFDDF